MNTEEKYHDIQRVVILGGGLTGWMVAAGLCRQLKSLGIEIVLIENFPHNKQQNSFANSESDSNCVTTLPSIYQFHNLLGVSEHHVVAATGATYTFGNRYQAWVHEKSDYTQPFSDHGFMLNRVEFQHYITRCKLLGRAMDYDDYSLSAVAARLGRFRHPSSQGNSIYSTLAYGLQINGTDYAHYMKSYATHMGVKHIEANISFVSVNHDGLIASVSLSDIKSATYLDVAAEGVIDAEFFIDCSGANGRLIEQTLKVDFQDVSFLHANRAVSIISAADSCPSSSLLMLAESGWKKKVVTRKYAEQKYYFNNQFSSDDDAIVELQVNDKNTPAENAIQFLSIRVGRRKTFWEKNCVAIGDAAGNLENFVVGNVHVVQSAVLRLLALFPNHRNAEHCAAEYNRLTHQEYDHISDFHSLHYHLARGMPTDFWKAAAQSELSERLTHKLELFKARGSIAFYEGETLSPGVWTSFLMGNGIWPERYDPLTDSMGDVWIDQQLNKMKHVINEAATVMPFQADYLHKMLQPTNNQ